MAVRLVAANRRCNDCEFVTDDGGLVVRLKVALAYDGWMIVPLLSRKTGAIIPDDLFERSSFALASVRPKGVAPGASDSQIEANSRANE